MSPPAARRRASSSNAARTGERSNMVTLAPAEARTAASRPTPAVMSQITLPSRAPLPRHARTRSSSELPRDAMT
eukprot:CAMPEP_0118994048 /NCGR_PEP_ID=MMETSP1173-20130426/56139_1 /TAXON_ID=1034831 /ORGANISM="Rhizochromulina marina cf, Strain CCMP1243" /LENGTH=73 /DNA_ID=CAMNT_0006945311 /DNA_START=554 /DNA_END=775 /DNA_ORIENTATION=-